MKKRCKDFLNINVSFILLSLLMIVAVLVICRYSRLPALPFFHCLEGPAIEDQIPCDLAIGYIASYIFYIIQVFIPQKHKERKALKAIFPYLKEYVMYMKILGCILKNNKLEELPDLDDALGKYKYSDQHGNVYYEAFPDSINLCDETKPQEVLYDNRFMSFLLKIQHVYNTMAQSRSFMNMNEYVLEQIQKTDIAFWVNSYQNLLLMRKLGQEDIEILMKNEASGRNRLDELKETVDWIEMSLGLQSVVEKM